MADQISDASSTPSSPRTRTAGSPARRCVTTGLCVVAGEITTKAYVDIPRIVRDTINEHRLRPTQSFGFDGNTCGVIISIDEQSPDIAQGVDKAFEEPRPARGEDLSTTRAPATRG